MIAPDVGMRKANNNITHRISVGDRAACGRMKTKQPIMAPAHSGHWVCRSKEKGKWKEFLKLTDQMSGVVTEQHSNVDING